MGRGHHPSLVFTRGRALKELKIVVWLHVMLGPLGIYMMEDDAQHPERWVDWYRNPALAIPFCLAMEVISWESLLHH